MANILYPYNPYTSLIGGHVESCFRDKAGCLYSFCSILLVKSLTAVVIIIINLLLFYWGGGGGGGGG